jgi:phospho-N-acetylmuramoyl-pentapeptide-transferase
VIVDRIELSLILEALPALWMALAVSAAVAWPAMVLLRRFGVKQTISEYVAEHAHKQGTPTMGGIVVLVGVLAVLFLQAAQGMPLALATALAMIAFAAIGFVDDFLVPRIWPSKRGLGWVPKLLLQVVAASLVPAALQPNEIGRWNGVEIGLQIFFVLAFVNAYNFADGLDGLAGGLLLAMAAGAFGIALLVGSPFAAILSLALAGAIIPFLFLNAPPAKVFMGDVGSMPLGAALGYCALDLFDRLRPSSAEDWAALIPLGIWALVLIAELVPVPLQILSVKLTGRRMFPKTPIHHAFQVKGVPETRIVAGFVLLQIVASLAAFGYVAGLVAP